MDQTWECPKIEDILGDLKYGGEQCLRRDPRGVYQQFLVDFVRCAGAKEYGYPMKAEVLSSFMTPSMEAFLVVCYCNGMNRWNSERHRRHNPGSDTEVVRFRFTDSARGAKKNQGWSREGIDLYNQIWKKLKEQRAMTTLGLDFENALLQRIQDIDAEEREGDSLVIAENDLEELVAAV